LVNADGERGDLNSVETSARVPTGGSTTSTTSSGGESVKREVKTEIIGQGPNAVTRTTTIETRTTPDGRTHTSTTVKETRGATDTFAEVGRHAFNYVTNFVRPAAPTQILSLEGALRFSIHIHLLCLAADAGYINTDYIKFKIKQNTQITLRGRKIITNIFRNIRRKTAQSI